MVSGKITNTGQSLVFRQKHKSFKKARTSSTRGFINHNLQPKCYYQPPILTQGGRGPGTCEPDRRAPCLQIPVPGDVLPLGPEGNHNDANDAVADGDNDGDYDVVYAGGGEEDYGG